MAAIIEDPNTAADGVKSLKTFRRSKDLEDFYRFINENGLRREARHALEFITNRLAKPKKSKRGRKAKTVQ